MSTDIKNSCEFQILISQKSGQNILISNANCRPEIMLTFPFCVLVCGHASCSPAPRDPPILRPGAFRRSGCQLPLSSRCERFRSKMFDVTKAKRPCQNSRQSHDKVRETTLHSVWIMVAVPDPPTKVQTAAVNSVFLEFLRLCFE